MIDVFIADDHQMIIDGLKSLLEDEEDVRVTGQALNGLGVLAYLKHSPCHILLLDINMPQMDGISTTKEVKKKHPEVKVLILSMHNTKDFVESVMNAGAEGYILKNAGRDELLNAIKTIHKGGYFYGNDIMQSLINKSAGKQPLAALSKREIEIIQLLVQEYTTSEIAEKLCLSTHTVDTHRKNLLSKLSVRNIAGLVKYALQNNIS